MSTFVLPLGLFGGWVFVAIVVVVLAGMVYGIYSRAGSGIAEHPRSGDHAEDAGVGSGQGSLTPDAQDDENIGSFGTR